MSSESLSQNEIDALFSGGGTETATAPVAEAPEVQFYDFRRPSRISKDRKRSLSAMYGILAKGLEGWLTGRIRDPGHGWRWRAWSSSPSASSPWPSPPRAPRTS